MSNSLRRVRNNQKSRKAIMSPSISFFLAIFFSASLFAQNYTIQKSNTAENLRGAAVLSDDVAWAQQHARHLPSR
jgi:hypothetical protein